ncbi:MAG TPA: MarR family transcriptional regulator [archaeon]|nr:MarR family transcriptional regulator [archaeon]
MKGLVLLLLLVALPLGHASDLLNWDTQIDVHEDKTSSWTVIMEYNETVAKGEYFVLTDISDIESFVDEKPITCSTANQVGTLITCNTPGKVYSFKFNTGRIAKPFVNNLNAFQYKFSAIVTTDRLNVKIILPLGAAIVEKEVLQGTGLQPFEPSYGKEGSDGRKIFLQWTLINPKLGETVAASIIYEQLSETELFMNFAFIIAVIIAIVIITLFYFSKHHKNNNVHTVLPMLTDTERKVMEIVMRKGEVDQREIVRETEYSKAKVTRVIQDMESRGMLEKTRKGRRNIIKLKNELKGSKTDDKNNLAKK